MDAADLPPALAWERPLWDLYELVQHQWREGFNGRSGLDYGPALRLIDARGWDVDLCVQLLHAIEHEVLIRERDGAASGKS